MVAGADAGDQPPSFAPVTGGLAARLRPARILAQVVRLAGAATADLSQQFETVDACTTDILDTLQNFDRQRDFLRPHRDRLYSALLNWEPILKAWEELPGNLAKEADGVWRVVDDTYRFLAPRYISVQEWQSFIAPPDKTERGRSALVW